MSRVLAYRPSALALLFALGALPFTLLAHRAEAATTQGKPMRIDQIAPGSLGKDEKAKGKRSGPGNEQPTVTVVYEGGAQYQIVVYMSSNVPEGEGPWQGKCTSMKYGPEGVTVVADQVQITKGNPENRRRPFNHPILSSFATGIEPETTGQRANIAVLAYGSDVGNPNNNVQTKVVAINHLCQVVSDTVTISDNPNVNQGAPSIDHNGGTRFTTGYLDNGKVTHAVGLEVDVADGKATLKKTFDTKVVEPANIGRPTIASVSKQRSVLCAPKGDNRPPERGIECALLDVETGEILRKEIVAASDKDNNRFMNQAELGLLREATEGKPALLTMLYQESSGPPRNNDGNKEGKGTNKSHVLTFEPKIDGFDIHNDAGAGLPAFDAHAGLCTGTSPNPTRRFTGVMTGPITGIGGTSYHEITYDETQNKFKMTQEQELASWGDSGYLANRNGENPGQQGRDYYRCRIVHNDFYGIEGFAQTTQAIVLAPFAGHVGNEVKNRLSYSIIPAMLDANSTPGLSGGGASDDDEGGFQSAQSGCACTIPGSKRSASNDWSALCVLGLSIITLSRRRAKR